MIITASVIVPAVVMLTGIWSPYRWGAYFESLSEVEPVIFYGQVVDNDGAPVKDAQVRVQVTKHNWWFIVGGDSVTSYADYDIRTDARGRFQVEGKYGRAVSIENITVRGYELGPEAKARRSISPYAKIAVFYYAGGGVGRAGPHKPDPNNPVTFEMRKTE